MKKICKEMHKLYKLVHCPVCGLKIGKDYIEKLRDRVNAVPQEKKQKLLDGVWKGLKLGDAIKAAKIEQSVGFQIFADNIGDYHYLRKEAVK